MNIVMSGNTFQVYGNEVQTFKELPVGSYEINFHKMMGFFLSQRDDLIINEEKIYGNTKEKVNKIADSFEFSNRNFGVILSGQKGIGKTLFVRVLAQKMIELGIPVIICSHYYSGLENFISSIEQEVMVIFDEFEKTFAYKENEDIDPQEEMLSLFDGIDNGKKLFVITCNELRKLNEYLLNRPGRFHYHIKMSNPSSNEIKEYLYDNLKKEYWFNIEKIIKFSLGTKITYDILRAIIFELNRGYSLIETIEDLNIQNTNNINFNISLRTTNGLVFSLNKEREGVSINLFSNENNRFWVESNAVKNADTLYLQVTLKGSDIEILNENEFFIDPKKISIFYDENDYDDEELKIMEKLKVESIELTKKTISKYKFIL